MGQTGGDGRTSDRYIDAHYADSVSSRFIFMISEHRCATACKRCYGVPLKSNCSARMTELARVGLEALRSLHLAYSAQCAGHDCSVWPC